MYAYVRIIHKSAHMYKICTYTYIHVRKYICSYTSTYTHRKYRCIICINIFPIGKPFVPLQNRN